MAEIEYIVCPLCGRNRVLVTKEKGRVGWPNGTPLDFNSTVILQVRSGGGKKAEGGGRGYRGSAPGSGFHLVPEASLTLPEMIESGEYDEVLAEMKTQLLNVITQSIELGWIKKEEI